jgi:hypothetical protein
MRYGRRGGGRSSDVGRWPGNGPFRNLPPWERPGWLYGPGSCWTLGYWGSTAADRPLIPSNRDALKHQKDLLETQLRALQQSIERIEERLGELEE